MALNLKKGDVVFSVRTRDGVSSVCMGRVIFVDRRGALDVAWRHPERTQEYSIPAEELFRSQNRAVLAYLRRVKSALLAHKPVQNSPMTASRGIKMLTSAPMRVHTSELLNKLTRWTRGGVKPGVHYFAYLSIAGAGKEPVLFCAYKGGRDQQLKILSITEHTAKNHGMFARRNEFPSRIRTTDLWSLEIPQPWNQWIREPVPGARLYKH